MHDRTTPRNPAYAVLYGHTVPNASSRSDDPMLVIRIADF